MRPSLAPLLEGMYGSMHVDDRPYYGTAYLHGLSNHLPNLDQAC
jgi:hypothetical protein